MAIYKFDTDFGEMRLTDPTILLDGFVGPLFNDSGMYNCVGPVILDVAGNEIPWEFKSTIMPASWDPEDIEEWAENRLEEHKVL